MLKAGSKAPDFTLSDKDGMIEKVMPRVKPDTNAAEILEYLQSRSHSPN